jgi:hypothetical protein
LPTLDASSSSPSARSTVLPPWSSSSRKERPDAHPDVLRQGLGVLAPRPTRL